MLVGVDWGGTKIEAIAIDENGQPLARLREATPRSDYQGCLATIASLISRVEAKVGAHGSIGIGIPGSVDPRTGIAKGASSTWLNGKPAETDLRRTLGREVRVANDADCFAVSEAVDGAGVGHHVVFAVILGSGAGAGIAVAGKAHHGPNNSAGEWGHNPLPRPNVTEIPGPSCYCGRYGCLERWVSGWSFARDYHEHASIDLAPSEPLRPAEIVERMRQGDRLAKLVWNRYIDRVARGLSVVVNTLDPDILVLGGGMANIDELYDELPPRLSEETFSPCFYTPIARAVHGDSSGVRGAAWLWR
jgi:fructokinase